MAFVNRFFHFLTKRHDARNARHANLFTEDASGKVKLSDHEKVPSVMLAFDIIEKKTDEDLIIKFLAKIFEKNSALKTQYSSAGATLLFAACRKGYCEVIRYLISSDLNCKRVTPLGTVMHSLLEANQSGELNVKNFKEMAILVQQQGCNIDEINHNNMTPFLCAVEMCNIDAMKLFVELGCDINKAGECGFNAVHLVCKNKTPDVLQYLLTLDGIDVRAVSADGSTDGSYPLFLAVKEWHNATGKKQMPLVTQLKILALVERLLMWGADPHLLKHLFMKGRPGAFTNHIRETELREGKACKSCAELGRRDSHKRSSSRRCKSKSGHVCPHPIIGCPCRVTGTGGDYPPVEVNTAGEPTLCSADNSQCVTRDSVPLSSQIYATALLYSKTGPLEFDDEACNYERRVLCSDPYIEYVRRYFSEEWSDWERPVSLRNLCRSTIRVHLVLVGKFEAMASLPLPSALVDFVAMKVIE